MTSPAATVLPSPPPPLDWRVELPLRLGDDRLVLGHRLSEWAGHGPVLEEDIALSNVALDLLGHATLLLRLAGEREGSGRDEDALAYWREAVDFRCCRLVELPRGDFGFTIARSFLFDAHAFVQLDAIAGGGDAELAAIAAKALKETTYHLRHAADWVRRLGDGTDESHRRIQRAIDELWRFTGELFVDDEVDRAAEAAGAAPRPSSLRAAWDELVRPVLDEATLTAPADPAPAVMGRAGRHTEFLGHLLAEMQIVARSHPGATW